MSTQPSLSTPRLRVMTEADLRAVDDIERRAYHFPWNITIFRDCLRVGYHCCLLETSSLIRGYGIMSVAAGEAHILNLCIDPDFHGQGLARQLLEHLLLLAQQHQAQTLFLEVRPTNFAALRLYTAAGFCELGTRPSYYPAACGREDALIMAKTL